MKQPRNKADEPSTIPYIARPVFVDLEVTQPNLEPLFTNHMEFVASGTDIFLDVGVIDPADMTEMIKSVEEHPDLAPEVKFHVLQRIVMSPATLFLLCNKVNSLLAQMKEQMDASKNAAPTKP